MNLIKYLAPFPSGNEEKIGYPFFFKIGARRERFALQVEPGGRFELAHVKTGRKIDGLTNARLKAHAYDPKPARIKEVAISFLKDLLAQYGEERILAVIDSAPILNKQVTPYAKEP